jgi:hypothetical protein
LVKETIQIRAAVLADAPVFSKLVLQNIHDFAVSPDLAGTESFVEHSQPEAFRERIANPRFERGITFVRFLFSV